MFRFSFVGEFFANVKFTRCLHVVFGNFNLLIRDRRTYFRNNKKFYVYKCTIMGIYNSRVTKVSCQTELRIMTFENELLTK